VIYRVKLANCAFMARLEIPAHFPIIKYDAQLWTRFYTPVKQSDHEFTIFPPCSRRESINRFHYARRQKDGFRLQMRDRVIVYSAVVPDINRVKYYRGLI